MSGVNKVYINHEGYILQIAISDQKLRLLRSGRPPKIYPISTSKYGAGNISGSNKTPLGLHRIASKIGKNARLGAIFIRRRNTYRVAKIHKRKHKSDANSDLITSRILRLEGLEERGNRGKEVDSFKRCIYIHGTPQEYLIGKPASKGCIRMKNNDIIELFRLVKRKMIVNIKIKSGARLIK